MKTTHNKALEDLKTTNSKVCSISFFCFVLSLLFVDSLIALFSQALQGRLARLKKSKQLANQRARETKRDCERINERQRHLKEEGKSVQQSLLHLEDEEPIEAPPVRYVMFEVQDIVGHYHPPLPPYP